MIRPTDIPLRRALHRAAVLLVLALAGATVAAGERPRAGLLWNRTGLPATLPLVVRSLPGRDYVVVLRDADTGTEALAAYIRGGDFFRVLVPPGSFRLRFDYGTTWRGEDAGFAPGPATGHFELPHPLRFRVAGFNRRVGHVVDLRTIHGDGRQQEEAAVAPVGTCQRVAEPRPRVGEPPDTGATPRGPGNRAPVLADDPYRLRDRLLSWPC